MYVISRNMVSYKYTGSQQFEYNVRILYKSEISEAKKMEFQVLNQDKAWHGSTLGQIE